MTQEEALDVVKTGCNVYLTGSAGSGKTYILNRYISYLRSRGQTVAVTASTGIAATHLNGMTIHSWAGIGIKQAITASDLADLLKRKYLHKRFKDTKVLIIDEVSMLPSWTLEAVDQVARRFRETDLPFGGMQVVLCGDFFQLPPILSRHPELVSRSQPNSVGGGIPDQVRNDTPPGFIFKSPLWQEMDLKVCYLEKPFRQNDERFLELLRQIRENNVTRGTWDVLKERFLQPITPGVTPTRLYTHMVDVDAINNAELKKIDEEEQVFQMEIRGNETLAGVMKKSCLAPERLVVKKKALVMFVKNNSEGKYANGTMGRVIGFSDRGGYPIVQTFDGRKVTAYPVEWEIEEDGFVRARISQIPLRLAWAITIHKSQGMSLDAAEIDLGRSFVHGMGYVALSRVRKLEGIRLRSINRTALMVNQEIIEFDRQLQQLSASVAAELRGSYWYRVNAREG